MKVITIYGTIGRDWWSGEGVSAAAFAREFDAALASGEDIEIRINTPGGNVFEGIAIYNKIAENNAKVTTLVDGIAYSMGAVIAMAGKTRKAMKNATIMMHNVRGGVYGNANDVSGALEMMQKLDGALIISIAQITGLKEEEVKANWFDYRDHTLSAQEALEANLLTEIIDVTTDKVPENIAAMSSDELFAHYAQLQKPAHKNFFAELLGEIKNRINPTPPVAPANNKPAANSQPTNEDMKIMINKSSAAIVAALAISFAENETEKEVELNAEHLATLNSALAAAADKATTAENNLTTITAERDALQVKVNALPGASPAAPAATENPEGAPAAEEENEFLSDTDTKMKELRASIYGKEK
jgi:ATP-dependent Clp protease protease subunit